MKRNIYSATENESPFDWADEELKISPKTQTPVPSTKQENPEPSFTDLCNYGNQVLGNQSIMEWLIVHNPHLQARPVELLMTKEGLKRVWNELRRIEHGVFG